MWGGGIFLLIFLYQSHLSLEEKRNLGGNDYMDFSLQ